MIDRHKIISSGGNYMEGHGSRKLSWIAIALSGLALFVAISGRMHSNSSSFRGLMGYDGPQNFQAAPAAPGQFGPQGKFDRHGQFGPNDQFGPQGQVDPRGQFGPNNQGRFEGPMRGGGPRHGFPFFFLPFMLIGGLMRIAFVVLLVWLGLRLIRGGGGRGPWGRGPGGHGPWGRGPWDQSDRGDQPPPPSKPGPEQPPYTGETQQM
jgi:hypothetical protein